MRPEAPPAKPYHYQEYPCIMYPSTEMLATGMKRNQTANDAEDEAKFIHIGYQRTQAAEPVVPDTATKEEALAQQQAVFDAAWRTKTIEIQGLQKNLDAVTNDRDRIKADRDLIARRLAEITEKIAADKRAAKQAGA